MSVRRWTHDELKLAFHLHCQLPFGKLHRGIREIIEVAALIGRSASAVAMKPVNFASLDPGFVAWHHEWAMSGAANGSQRQ